MTGAPAAGAVPVADLERALDPRILAQLRAVPLDPARPLLVVDADEVLVEFAAHLGRFAATLGIDMRLERYELEGTFHDRAAGRRLDFAEAIGLINRFFAEETAAQQPVPGAAAALARLADRAQVVVLTNVPRHARETRIANLSALGMAYPLVENAGGKGRALAWLAHHAGRPAAFVDDSPKQIESARRRAPSVVRVHFVGAEYVARVFPESPEADHRAGSWAEAEALLARILA